MTSGRGALALLAFALVTLSAEARPVRELEGDQQFAQGNYKLARALYREALRTKPRVDRIWAKYDLAYLREMATESTVQTATTMAMTSMALGAAVAAPLPPQRLAQAAPRRAARSRARRLSGHKPAMSVFDALRGQVPVDTPLQPIGPIAVATPRRDRDLEPEFDRTPEAEARTGGPAPMPRIPGDQGEAPATDDAVNEAAAEARARAQAAEQARAQYQAAQAAEILRRTPGQQTDETRVPGGQRFDGPRVPGGQSGDVLPGDDVPGGQSPGERIPGGQAPASRVPGGQQRSQLTEATEAARAQGLVTESTQVATPAIAGPPLPSSGQPDGTTVLAPNEVVPVPIVQAGDALAPSTGMRGEPLVVRGTGWDVWDLRYGVDLAGRPHVVGKLRNLADRDLQNPTVYVGLIDPSGVQVAFKPVKLVDPAGVLFPGASGEFEAEFPAVNNVIAGYRLHALQP